MSKKNIVIGIVGPTNSGKSTLLNKIIGEKLSIVTHKAQTTRSGLRGLKVMGNTQMVFIDTPGIFDAKTKFEKAMLDNAFGILNDVDLIYLLIDCKKSLDKLDSIFTEKIKVVKHKTFLILNKIDLIKRSDLLEKVKIYNEFIDNVNNLNTFEIEDEVYHNLYLEPDSKPFLKAKTNETNEEHIVGWTYNYENGKVVYNALGHDSRSLLKPEMVNIIKKSVKWVSGDKDA